MQAAVAMRLVSGLEVICVMWTVWEGVRWGRSGSDAVERAWDLRDSLWLSDSGSVFCEARCGSGLDPVAW